jgi:hypothetical protein
LHSFRFSYFVCDNECIFISFLFSNDLFEMSRNKDLNNPFQDSSESEADQLDQATLKKSNNRGTATRMNKPYIPLITHRIERDNKVFVRDEIPIPNHSHHDMRPSNLEEPVVVTIERHICYVCRRKFRDYDHLKRHQRTSYMHKSRLEANRS